MHTLGDAKSQNRKAHEGGRRPAPRRSPTDAPVGYARPPIHTRFKSGKSGNPKGAPAQ
jgi:hypothetical protein